jgi:membrane associated rhomboid family serine protease
MPIRLTQAVKALLIACFAVFLVQQTGDQFFGTRLTSLLGLVPASFAHQYRLWQLLTYSFLHADVMHLFFNLMMLAFIGGELEAVWGTPRFLRYYFFCSVTSGLVYLALQLGMNGPGIYAPLIGASGAIYGLLMAYGLIFGERVLLFMMLFPMKAKHFIWVLALIQLMTTVYSPSGGWASLAHLSGLLAGLVYLWLQARWSAARKHRDQFGGQKKAKKRRAQHHLKLIVNNDREFESSDDESENNPKTWH